MVGVLLSFGFWFTACEIEQAPTIFDANVLVWWDEIQICQLKASFEGSCSEGITEEQALDGVWYACRKDWTPNEDGNLQISVRTSTSG